MSRMLSDVRLPRPKTIAWFVVIIALYQGVEAFSAAADLHRDADVVVVSNADGYWTLVPQTINVTSGASTTATGLTVTNAAGVDASAIDLSVSSDPAGLFRSMDPNPFPLVKGSSQSISFTVDAANVSPGNYTITLRVAITNDAGRVEMADIGILVEVRSGIVVTVSA